MRAAAAAASQPACPPPITTTSHTSSITAAPAYFPMQNWPNTESRISSAPTCPVIRPSARSATRKSSPRSSGRAAASASRRCRRRLHQGGAVPRPGERRRPLGLRQLGGDPRQHGAKPVHAEPGQRAHPQIGIGRRAPEIGLVGDRKRPRVRTPRGCAAVSASLHDDQQIGRCRPRPRASDALGLDRIAGLAQPGGVEQRHRHAAQHHARLQHVARGSRRGRHDRHVAPGQRIDQRRFADIRRPGDREHQAVAQPLAAAVVVQMGRDLASQRADLRQHRCFHGIREILIGKIDQRLLLRQQPQQPVGPAAIDAAQRPAELLQRLATLRRTLGRDQVGDRLGLQQVHSPVEERPPRELARLPPAARPASPAPRQRRPRWPARHAGAARRCPRRYSFPAPAATAPAPGRAPRPRRRAAGAARRVAAAAAAGTAVRRSPRWPAR